MVVEIQRALTKSAAGPDRMVTTANNMYGIAEYTPFRTIGLEQKVGG